MKLRVADAESSDWLSAAGNYGYQTVNSTGYFGTTVNYSNWNMGLTATYKNFSLTGMYSQTDLSGSAGDSKFVVSVGASF